MNSDDPTPVPPPVDDRRWRLLAFACLALAGALVAGQQWWSSRSPASPPPARSAAATAGHAGAAAPASMSTIAGMTAPAAPAAPETPASAAAHELAPDRIAAMAERLAERLARQPGDADGWAMLARTHAVSGRHDKAVAAFRKAEALRPDDAVLLADFADALAMTQQRRIAGEPLKLVQRALELAPDNLKALSLAGTEAFDRGDHAAAVRHWEALTRRGGPDSVFAQQVSGGLQEARRRASGQGG